MGVIRMRSSFMHTYIFAAFIGLCLSMDMPSAELDPETQSPWLQAPPCPEGQHECKVDDVYKGKSCSEDDKCLCINCCVDPPICEICTDPPVPSPPSVDLEDLPPPPSSMPPAPPSSPGNNDSSSPDYLPDPPAPPPPQCPEREPWRNDLCTELDQKFKFPTKKPCVDACKTGCDCLCEAMGSSVIDQYCIKEASKLDRCRCCCKDITEVEPLQLPDKEEESDAVEQQLLSNKEEELQS